MQANLVSLDITAWIASGKPQELLTLQIICCVVVNLGNRNDHWLPWLVLYGSLDGLRIEHSCYNRAQLSQKKKTLGPAGLLSFHI